MRLWNIIIDKAEYIKTLTDDAEISKTLDEIIGICESEETKIPSWLLSKEDFDVRVGLSKYGSAENYVNALINFGRNSSTNIRILHDALEDREFSMIESRVRTIESAANSIGVGGLADIALKAEAQARRGDIDGLHETMPIFFQTYGRISMELLPLQEKSDRIGVQIAREDLPRLYAHLMDYLNTFNYDAVGSMLNSLDQYDFPGDEQRRFENLKAAYEAIDWTTMHSLLSDVTG